MRDLGNESIAYALATGMIIVGSHHDIDRDVDREARKARWQRRKAKR